MFFLTIQFFLQLPFLHLNSLTTGKCQSKINIIFSQLFEKHYAAFEQPLKGEKTLPQMLFNKCRDVIKLNILSYLPLNFNLQSLPSRLL